MTPEQEDKFANELVGWSLLNLVSVLKDIETADKGRAFLIAREILWREMPSIMPDWRKAIHSQNGNQWRIV